MLNIKAAEETKEAETKDYDNRSAGLCCDSFGGMGDSSSLDYRCKDTCMQEKSYPVRSVPCLGDCDGGGICVEADNSRIRHDS